MPPFAATSHSKSVGNLYCFPVFSFRRSKNSSTCFLDTIFG